MVVDISADTEVISQGCNSLVEHLVLYIKKYNLIAITVYRPTHDEFSQLSPVLREIKQILLNMSDLSPLILICGDFNLPDIESAAWIAADGYGGSGVRHRMWLSPLVGTTITISYL